MISNIIKFYFIYLYSTYLSQRLMNYKSKNKFSVLLINILSLFLTFLTLCLMCTHPEWMYTIPILLFWLFTSLTTFRPKESLIANSVSLGINYGLFVLSGFCSLLVLYPFHPDHKTFPYILLALSTTIIYTIFIILLLNIKRFKKGILLLSNKDFVNIGTVICLFIISFITPMTKTPKFWFMICTFILFISLMLFLIHWWQAQITKSYKQALTQRELESLRTELAEKDKLLAQLTKQNEELGRLIHQDNKRIPAMENAVCEYLATDFTNTETAITKGNSLLLEIQELSQNRSNTLADIYTNKCRHHDTGISTLDNMLNYMEKRAHQEQITFSVNIAVDLHTFVPSTIEPNDLTHVLSDLLENAIIATTHSENPTVQLQFYFSEKYFVIEVADNGIPFESISLVNFGLMQLTTHSDTGGSGIGLMDIWKIKEKYMASLHISEYDTESTYSKKISIIFDKKRRYSISSYRKEELLQLSKRTDLQIF